VHGTWYRCTSQHVPLPATSPRRGILNLCMHQHSLLIRQVFDVHHAVVMLGLSVVFMSACDKLRTIELFAPTFVADWTQLRRRPKFTNCAHPERVLVTIPDEFCLQRKNERVVSNYSPVSDTACIMKRTKYHRKRRHSKLWGRWVPSVDESTP
jgi:hypothetical protein